MRKMIVVAVREYLAAVRSKAFIISLVIMPVFMGASILVQAYLRDKVDITDKRIAVVDRTGILYDTIAEEADRRNDPQNPRGIYNGEGEGRKQVRPRFVVEEIKLENDDLESVTFQLSERVRERELLAFVVIEPDVAGLSAPGDVELPRVLYHSNSPAYNDASNWLSGLINRKVQAMRFAQLSLDPAVVSQATRGVPVDRRGLVSRDELGQIKKAERSIEQVGILVPMGMMMLMFMMVMLGAQPLLQSVLEEKMQRIAEVLLASVPPFELMMGKLIGMVAVSLTMVAIYLSGAAYAIHRAGFGDLFPTHLVLWFIIFQSLAVLMYGSVFAAVGAAVTDMKEAQSMVTPLMLVVVAPMFVWFNVVREPHATSSLVMSLFPPATPMLMVLRQSTPGGVPTWQPLVGIVLVLLTTIASVFVAGRIFRVGILMQGKGARLGEMLRWAIRG